MLDALYEFLRSLGFHDPLHAPIVHMPIGLGVGAFLFFAVALFFRREKLALTARHVSILALLFVFPTILLGVLDWLHFFKGALIPAIRIKMVLAAVITILLAAGIIAGRKVPVRKQLMMVIYALTFVSLIAVGYFGARLVYGGWTPSSGTEAVLSAEAQAGEKVFAANCQGCHPNGGNVMAVELPLKTSPRLKNRDGFVAFIRAPKMRDGSPGDMPAFPKEKLDDKQAAGLFEYINAMLAGWK